jgi:hypothetical protein
LVEKETRKRKRKRKERLIERFDGPRLVTLEDFLGAYDLFYH